MMHVGVEETNRAPPLPLGGVKRHIRRLQQLAGRGRVARGESDADAGADRGEDRAELIGRRQLAADAQRQDARLVAVTGDRLDDGEFVAAEPADELVGPGQGA